jgi:MSHA biogenesis protein MshQ
MRGAVIALLACACSLQKNLDAAHDADPIVDAAIDAEIDAPPAEPCLAISAGMWCRRRTVTVDTTKVVGGPHAAFPMLVSIPMDADLAAHARMDGFDILFVDGTTPLVYEREKFVKQTGELVAWVRVPSLAAGTTTSFHLYYGNATAADQQMATAVWDTNYQAVLHLREGAGGTDAFRDSTTRNNHGTNVNGGTPGGAGAIGNAFAFDGTNDRLRLDDSGSLDSTAAQGTFEVWLKYTDASNGAYQFILSNSNWVSGGRASWEWASQPGGAHYFYPWRGDTNNYNLGPNPFTDGKWHHAAVTYRMQNREVAIYIDGVALAFTTTNCPQLWTTIAAPADWLFGGNPDLAGSHFGGMLDEIRISNVVRSVAWLQTEYANQSAPAAFAPIGAVEVLRAP